MFVSFGVGISRLSMVNQMWIFHGHFKVIKEVLNVAVSQLLWGCQTWVFPWLSMGSQALAFPWLSMGSQAWVFVWLSMRRQTSKNLSFLNSILFFLFIDLNSTNQKWRFYHLHMDHRYYLGLVYLCTQLKIKVSFPCTFV